MNALSSFRNRVHCLLVGSLALAALVLVEPVHGQKTPAAKVFAISAKGTFVASVEGFAVRLTVKDLPTSYPLMMAEKNPIFSLAFTPDNMFLLAGTSNGTVIFWDLTKIDLEKKLMLPAVELNLAKFGDVNSLTAYVWEARRFVVAAGGKTVCIADLASRREVQRFTVDQNVRHLAAAPNGKTVAVGVGDKQVVIWDAQSGQRLGALQAAVDVQELTINQTGTALAARTEKGIKLWDLQVGKKVMFLATDADPLRTIKFSDAGTLTTLSEKGNLAVFNLKTGDATMSGVIGTRPLGLSADGGSVAMVKKDSDKGETQVESVKDLTKTSFTAVAPDKKWYLVPVYYSTNRKMLEGVKDSRGYFFLRFFATLNGWIWVGAAMALCFCAWLAVYLFSRWPAAPAGAAFTADDVRKLCAAVAFGGLLETVLIVAVVHFFGWGALGLFFGIAVVFALVRYLLRYANVVPGLVWLVAVFVLVILAGAGLDAFARSWGEAEQHGAFYSGDTDTQLHFGICQVSIPPTHERGNVEVAKTYAGIRIEVDNPDRHMLVQDVSVGTESAFFQKLKDAVKEPRKSALVFIHGYNVTFKDAALRTAQLKYDLQFEGPAIFFSWPSQGTELGYFWDADAVLASVTPMKYFLTEIALQTDAKEIFVIAHSMGNRVLTDALVDLKQPFEHGNHAARFKEIILAAPDINAHRFETEIAPVLAATYPRVTLYANAQDYALALSRRFNNSRRAGDPTDGIIVTAKMDSIDVSNLDTSPDSHGYFSNNTLILSDLFALITDNKAVPRFGMIGKQRDGLPYFEYRK